MNARGRHQRPGLADTIRGTDQLADVDPADYVLAMKLAERIDSLTAGPLSRTRAVRVAALMVRLRVVLERMGLLGLVDNNQ